jgi:hypothetical protein
MPDGKLSFLKRPGAAGHFRAALQDNPGAIASISAHFERLRDALSERVAAKRAYIIERGIEPVFAIDPDCFTLIAGGASNTLSRRAANSGPTRSTTSNYSFRMV